MSFSDRLPPHAAANPISRAVAALRASGTSFVDLTASNPTTEAIAYPPDLLAPLGDPGALRYEPSPLGLASARAAIAHDFARRGAEVNPSDLVLSSSTSEAYAWLFKLLCAPGEGVLVPHPSYPLFEHLTRLEGVAAHPYYLEYHGRWEIDFDSIRAAPRAARALLLVSPNNPTGSYVSARELERLFECCHDRGWALVVDEVFADYPLEESQPLTDLAVRADVLSFTLAGASKTLGLPQIKLAWTLVGGPSAARRPALSALELIADTFLSVSTPVQVAAPELLRCAASVRQAIHERVRENLTRARDIVAAHPACQLLRVEGGWSAVVRVPATRGEERLVLDLLQSQRVLVHPGYFFDLPHEAFVIVSLLPRADLFADAFRRTIDFADS